MESIYAALLLHKASKKITAANIEKILKAAGVEPDSTQITKLITGLKKTKIDDIIKSVAAGPVMTSAPVAKKAPAAKKRASKKKEEEPEEEPTGIGSLF